MAHFYYIIYLYTKNGYFKYFNKRNISVINEYLLNTKKLSSHQGSLDIFNPLGASDTIKYIYTCFNKNYKQ